MDSQTPSRSKAGAGRVFLRLFVALIVIGGLGTLLYSGFRTRQHDKEALDTNIRDTSRLTVSVGHAQPAQAGIDEAFPANIQAFTDTPIYARTNGYLKRWLVDIGGHVEAGQLLAEIDTPEIDQQLRQSEATQASLQAAVDLDRTTAARYQDLLKSDGVSKQEVDRAVGEWRTEEGKLKAAIADAERWKYMQSYKEVKAPFSGTITARNVDIGALISAGTNTILFRLADVATLRVYTNVPENYAHNIRAGMAAQLEVPSIPGKSFTGTVARTSGTIDPATRTLLTEVQVRNPGGALVPGQYGQVSFHLPTSGSAMIVAASALLFRPRGPEIAVVDDNGKVHLQAVKLGRDFGRTIEVVQGLDRQASIILNPSDSITEGTLVTPVPVKTGQ